MTIKKTKNENDEVIIINKLVNNDVDYVQMLGIIYNINDSSNL